MSEGATAERQAEDRIAQLGFRVRVESAGEGGEIAVVSPEDEGDWEGIFAERDSVIERVRECGFRYATLAL